MALDLFWEHRSQEERIIKEVRTGLSHMVQEITKDFLFTPQMARHIIYLAAAQEFEQETIERLESEIHLERTDNADEHGPLSDTGTDEKPGADNRRDIKGNQPPAGRETPE